MDVSGSQESGLNINTTCSWINAAFPPLCCYSRTNAGIPLPPLGERGLGFHCKTSAGGSDKYTLKFACDVMIATFLPLCFLCKVAGCGRNVFPAWQLYYCLPLDWLWSLLSEWVGGWVFRCVCVGGGKYNRYRCHNGREMSHDMNLTILFART